MPASASARRAAKPRGTRSASKTRSRLGWIRLWPLLLCLLIAPFAVRLAGVLALEGPKPFALLYPWVEVVRSPVFHLSADLMSTLSQWLLYLQFPLYGLLMTVTLRADKHLRAFIIGLCTHFGGLALAVLLAWFVH